MKTHILLNVLAILGGLTAGAAAQEPANLASRLGYPADAKLLIIHADDLGVAHSVNRASMAALDGGLVNSASIMVPCPWFPEIAEYARRHPDRDLGLHLTLTSEWKNYRWDGVLGVKETPSLHDQNGFLHADTPQVAQGADPKEAEREVRAQVERALAFGVRPTHFDTHMGSLLATPDLLETYLKLGREYGIPVLLPRETLGAMAPETLARLPKDTVLIDHLRIASPTVSPERWDEFYSGLVENLKPGVTEIIVHLGYDDPELQSVTIDHPDYGAAWRQRDFDYFTSPRFASLLERHNVRLVTWREIGRLLHSAPPG